MGWSGKRKHRVRLSCGHRMRIVVGHRTSDIGPAVGVALVPGCRQADTTTVQHNARPIIPLHHAQLLPCPTSECAACSAVLPDRPSLMAHADTMARTIAEKSPVAVQGTKLNMNYSRDHTIAEGLEFAVRTTTRQAGKLRPPRAATGWLSLADKHWVGVDTT